MNCISVEIFIKSWTFLCQREISFLKQKLNVDNKMLKNTVMETFVRKDCEHKKTKQNWTKKSEKKTQTKKRGR